jgi:hypothetical protein
MYFEVHLEVFCGELSTSVGLEDGIIYSASLSSARAVLASKPCFSFGNIDSRVGGIGWFDVCCMGSLVRTQQDREAEGCAGGAL